MRIGVCGYSTAVFDQKKAEKVLLETIHGLGLASYSQSMIVSGLTNLGVPAIAYRLANFLGMQTMGIACAKAHNYECFGCDRVHIIGKEWGDESLTFLASIDVLIRIGGGKQSKTEAEIAKTFGIRVIEYDF